MKKIIFAIFLFIGLFVKAQDQVDYFDFMGNVTTTIRNTFTVPPGGAILVYNTTTSQFEWSNSQGVWNTFGGSAGADWDTNLINIPADIADGDDDTIADGSETKLSAGTNVTITGMGTTGSPYVINSTANATDAMSLTSETNTVNPLGDVWGFSHSNAGYTHTYQHVVGSIFIQNQTPTLTSRLQFNNDGTVFIASGSNNYLFDGTYNENDDVARKVNVDAAISAANQTLSLAGTTLSISGGNNVSLGSFARLNVTNVWQAAQRLLSNTVIVGGGGNQAILQFDPDGTASTGDERNLVATPTDITYNGTSLIGGAGLTADQAARNINNGKPAKTLLKNDDFTLVANDMYMQTSGNAELGLKYRMTVNDGGTTVATMADVGAVDDIGRIRTATASDIFEAIPDTGVTLDWETKTGTENAVRVNGKGHTAYFLKTSANNYFFYGDITGYTYTPPVSNLYQENSAANGGTGVGSWIPRNSGTVTAVTDGDFTGGTAIELNNNGNQFDGGKILLDNATVAAFSNGAITTLDENDIYRWEFEFKTQFSTGTPQNGYFNIVINGVTLNQGGLTGSTTISNASLDFTIPAGGVTSGVHEFRIASNYSGTFAGWFRLGNLRLTKVTDN